MFGLFNNKPLLDPTSRQWLLDAFAWSLKHFDADLFYADTRLVLPTNECFPGRVDSVAGMANLIFDQVKAYAAVSHWPTKLVDATLCPVSQLAQAEIKGALRGPNGISNPSVAEEHRLQIAYNPQQINNPEGMIASFAHVLAHHLAQTADEPPPGGPHYWPQATELLAVYLGFGLMFANSAFTFRTGCGSCYNPNAVRDAYLTEYEATYALAIFARLQGLPASAVTGHLKKHLRGFYKKALKETQVNNQDVSALKNQAPIHDDFSNRAASGGRSTRKTKTHDIRHNAV
jgi:hypothetical protein